LAEDLALISDLHSLQMHGIATLPDLSPQQKKERTLEALLRQAKYLSLRQPVLMIFEDLHWMDPSSRELVDRMIEQVEHCPVLLVGSFRPEFQPPWAGQSHVTVLTLPRLDRHGTPSMVTAIAGQSALPPDVVQEIAERTDGVPLFIEELTKAVLEAGTDQIATLSAAPSLALSVPATLHASLMARLDRLGTVAKAIAQKGAAIGREFEY
jgi:predicted ATPase